MTYVIISTCGTRPLKLEGMASCLIFESEQDAKDYGARPANIYRAESFGILEAHPNVQVNRISNDDCTFEFAS